jgi:sugar lactone lactonase YvrE
VTQEAGVDNQMPDEQLLVDGLTFPEGPRWYDDCLWFSDIRGGTVFRVDSGGSLLTVANLDDSPSGLGFLPDGTPLIVSMRRRAILRLVDGGLETHADLAELPGDFLNDMVVDGEGRAYVGLRSSSLYAGMPADSMRADDALVIVDPDGGVRIGASGLVSPNGTVISPDGSTLIVAETYAGRILAFDRHADGALSGMRVFATVPGCYPDGICLDDEGAVWFGSPYTNEVVRVMDGGRETHRRHISGAVACALGGPGRTTLFVMAVDPGSLPLIGSRSVPGGDSSSPPKGGRIWTLQVAHPGAGWP